MLRAWRLSAARPELIRLLNHLGKGKALQLVADAQEQEVDQDGGDGEGAESEQDDEGDEKARKWDPLSEECRAAAVELRKLLRKLKDADPETPSDVRAELFGDEGSVAAETLQAWRALLEHARPHVRSDLSVLIRGLEAALGQAPDWAAQTDDDHGVEGALEYMGALIRVATQFVTAVRVERFMRSAPYVPVSFDVLALQIAAEIRAFQEAARTAAVHQGVFGALVENHVHSLIERWVRPASLSSGAIAGLRFPNQIDGIIWDHRLLPALVERGGVAVVPATAVFGVFELKASKKEDLATFSSRIDDLREHLRALRSQYAELRLRGPDVPVLGILIRSRDEYDDVRFLTGQNVTALLHEDDEGELHVNLAGVYDVLRFIFEQVNPLLGRTQ